MGKQPREAALAALKGAHSLFPGAHADKTKDARSHPLKEEPARKVL